MEVRVLPAAPREYGLVATTLSLGLRDGGSIPPIPTITFKCTLFIIYIKDKFETMSDV